MDAPESEAGAEAPAAAPARPQRASAASFERPSLTAAFRNAYRPAHVREDIAALPWLIRSRSFLVAVALVIGGTIAVAVAPTNVIGSLMFQALVVPPAMAPIFIVGFFAKRASYLLGLIVSLVDVAAYAVFIYAIAPGLSSDPIDPAQQQGLVFSALSVGPLSGIFFAASAAWYRRFLALSNANAANRARAKAQQRARAGKAARG
ncbi:MAG TPA: hypothetical protein VFX65_00030 [Candidatus Limnocylindrales bacterium]|nr:hypothetical protein [Candidatus Limnocylindrales bacterium]